MVLGGYPQSQSGRSVDKNIASLIRPGNEPSKPSSSKCNSLMHKNIHFGFNWCVASHLCSTQINSKSSKSRVCMLRATFKIPRASISMLGLGSGSPSKSSTEHARFIPRPGRGYRFIEGHCDVGIMTPNFATLLVLALYSGVKPSHLAILCTPYLV